VDVHGNKLDDCTEGRSAGVVGNTLIADIDPTYDICSEGRSAGSTTTPPVYQVEMTGKNIGDLLTAKGISWGWFSGGFTLPTKGDCNSRSRHIDSSGNSVYNYYPDVEPFQYYKSTANPQHLPPTSSAMVGLAGDQANHQYSLSGFWAAVMQIANDYKWSKALLRISNSTIYPVYNYSLHNIEFRQDKETLQKAVT
jgi:phospholipase C